MNTKGKPSDAACGCGVNGSARTPGPRGARRATGVDPGLKTANLRHLRRIEGQVRGVLRMIDEDRYCADIITQVAAIRESLGAVARNLFRNHVSHCAREAMKAGEGRADAMAAELGALFARVSR